MQLARRCYGYLALLAALLALPGPLLQAAVLPEDRADVMYHYYDGGGTSVGGPAVLVRKGMDQFSLSASYYVDSISGASIDVVTTASPYKEKRQEQGVALDYLYRNTTMNLSYSTSDEPDYTASTFGVNVAHEIFDGLTTVNLGYTAGSDEVGKVQTDFKDDINRYQYRLGISQVMSKTLLMSLDYEGILEDGYLNSPYRAARLQGLLVPERYPGTRDSYAVALRAMKGLLNDQGSLDSSLRLEYRYFWDTWQIKAHTLELGYQRRLGSRWTIEPRYRYYHQSAASFYSDNFPSEMTYMARDKELSSFSSHSLGIKASYKWSEHSYRRVTLNAAHDYVRFYYDDFTDMRTGDAYEFDANILQLFVSIWY
ncbi:MAG: DUF3570 domain-containing protein [Gammaproteobacteria bacterium]|nr:DUF3570 domain-containing protein [Gammaproteobacteria bacterium]